MSVKTDLLSVHRAILVLTAFLITALFASCGGGSGGSPSKGGPPTLTSLNPSSVEAGSAGFTITVNGTNFDSSCEVEYTSDGELLSTFSNAYVSSTELQAPINASDVAQIGAGSVIVGCTDGGGSLPFLVTGFPRIEIEQAANDLVWDPVHQVIYLSVPPTVPGGSGIAVLDPVTAKLLSFTPLGNNPDVLAISDDGQYLYVGLDDTSSIQRFTLPQLVADISFPIGVAGDFPFDIQVEPGAPHTTAVSLGVPDSTTPASAGVTIFDDGVPRPTSVPGPIDGGLGTCYCGSLQWGSAESTLYSNNSMSTGFDFYSLSVNANGAVLSQDYPNVFSSFNGAFWNSIHYLPSTGLVYADDRTVVNPSGGIVLGTFNLPAGAVGINRMVPDSTLDLATFLFQANCVYDGPGSCYIVSTFHLSDLSYLNSFTVTNIQGVYGAINMVRWGKNGLAFNTDTGQVYLVDITTLVQSASTAPRYREGSQRYVSVRNPQRILTTSRKGLLGASSNNPK
jgi:hypothetical protein